MSIRSLDKGAGENHYVQTIDMHTAVPPSPQMAPYQRTYGNPAPLGTLAYGTVILCASVLTLHAGNVYTPNIVLVFALFFGGISQTLAAMWDMFLGNTFTATLFATYGGFNFSYGALYLPQIGIAAAYSVDGVPTQEFFNAIGIYLSIWCFITLLFFIGALRTTVPFVATLGTTVIALACLAANSFTGNTHLATAGGVLGIIAACGAYYAALTMLWTQTTTFSFVHLPPMVLAPLNV